MDFESELIPGLLIKRYKRFFVDIKIKNKIITAHCPNTGSMEGLLIKKNKVWISKSNNPKRKLKYTLQIIEDKGNKVGVNTHLTNKIFEEALRDDKLKEFKNNFVIKPEVKYGSDTRFDFLLTKDNYKAFIEVKNVTLSRSRKIAEFPDSVTTRGAKHLNNLLKASQEGYKIYIAYVVQREDCNKFSVAKDIDPEYFELLTKAINNNLNVICYDCKFSRKGIKLNKILKFYN